MTQNDLAALLSADRTTVAKWESGKQYPPLNQAKLLCELYGVSMAIFDKD